MGKVTISTNETLSIEGIPTPSDVPVVVPGLILKNYDKNGAFLNISKVSKTGDAEPIKYSTAWIIGIALSLLGIMAVLFHSEHWGNNLGEVDDSVDNFTTRINIYNSHDHSTHRQSRNERCTNHKA